MSGVPDAVESSLRAALGLARGHFAYESGHHGDTWLDLDGLLLEARRARGWAAALAARAAGSRPEIVCGPLTGGAFVAQLVAVELDAGFAFAERVPAAAREGGATARYHIPPALRVRVAGRTVLLVDDAINAGSALRATFRALRDAGAAVVGAGALLAQGDIAQRLAAEFGVPVASLLTLERHLWPSRDCPLCAAGTALDEP